MGSLPPARAGVGSAVNDTVREFGGALGVAVIGSVAATSYASSMHGKLQRFPGLSGTDIKNPEQSFDSSAANLPIVDPTKIKSPVLMVRGEFDGNSTNDDLLDFYRQLPNGDRQFVILPQTLHAVGYSNNRHLLWYAMKNFLAAPAPTA